MKTALRFIFILFILLTSCAIGQTKEQILDFELIIGKENYHTLSILTSAFEKDILKKNYPTLATTKAYKKFLTDVKDGRINFWYKISTKSRETFKKSALRLEIYEYPDSVWIEGRNIKSRYIYENKDGTRKYGFSFRGTRSTNNLDSLVKSEYQTPRLRYSGKYLKAIQAIKKGNSFLEAFYNVKESAGYIYSEVMSSILLKNNPDFSNDITKRLIVMEFGY